MMTQKGKLFQLAEAYNNYRNGKSNNKIPGQKNKKAAIKCKQFDEGMSIHLSYNVQLYPEPQSDPNGQRVVSSQMSFIDDNSQAFYVEPFEAENTIEVPFRELNETSEEKLNKVVKADNEIKEVQPDYLPDAETGEGEKKPGDIEQKSDQVVGEKDEAETVKDEKKDQQEIVDRDVKVAGEGGSEDKLKVEGNEKEQIYEVSDEEFANDIGSILKGQKIFDQHQKKLVKPEEIKQKPTNQQKKEENPLQPVAAGDDSLDPDKNEHKIFEKIAQSMRYANSYDLGTIAMGKKFDLMDKEIEQQEIDTVLTEQGKNEGISNEEISSLKKDNVPGISSPEANDSTDPKTMIERYDPNVALDINNGGRLIETAQLQIGDLILSAVSGDVNKIDEGLIVPDAIAGVYIGNNKLVVRGNSGVLEEQPIQSLLVLQGVSVILRHQNMTNDKATAIAGTLSKLRSEIEKSQPEILVKVNCPSISIHPDVCTTSENQDKCHSYTGKINLGTTSNDSFICPTSIVKAFENNQITFINSGISGLEENKTIEKDHNGQLKYFGHLEKNI